VGAADHAGCRAAHLFAAENHVRGEPNVHLIEAPCSAFISDCRWCWYPRRLNKMAACGSAAVPGAALRGGCGAGREGWPRKGAAGLG
jgi:hypothetical protein